MQTYLRIGDTFKFGGVDVEVCTELPPAKYLLTTNSEGVFVLKYIEPLDDIEDLTLYGNISKDTDRIVNTYVSNNYKRMGVLFSGMKGSGKTLATKIVASKLNLPVIVITEGYTGSYFMSTVNSITQNCVVVFEELDKAYMDADEQKEVLQIMDGMFASNKLVIITCNDLNEISPYLLNRPGRARYHIQYTGLSIDQIKEFLYNNLEDISGEMLTTISKSLYFKTEGVTYDMLKEICKEVEMYPESISTVVGFNEMLRVLNISSEKYDSYFAEVTKKVSLIKHSTPITDKLWEKYQNSEYRDIELPDEMEVIYNRTAYNFDPFTETMNFSPSYVPNVLIELGVPHMYKQLYKIDSNMVNYYPDEYNLDISNDGVLVCIPKNGDETLKIEFHRNRGANNKLAI